MNLFVDRAIDKSHFRPIVHIAAIPKSESINIHLVAVTHTGNTIIFLRILNFPSKILACTKVDLGVTFIYIFMSFH